MMRRGVSIVMLATVLLMAACGGGESSDSDGQTPTPETTLAIPLEIGEVQWTSAVDPVTGAPVDSLTSLPNTAEHVTVVLAVPSLPQGTTLQARWSIDGDPIPALDPEPVVADRPLEEAWVSWRLTWTADEPWPIGTLGITVEADGQPVASAQLQIVRDRS